MAQTFLLLLLFVSFRHSERWMRQHIFKVGWLLTHDRKTTVIFYYTAFLPGVVLHELCRWLAAGVLNVRADQSLRLPQNDDISGLELGLVQISPNARPWKKLIIEGAPLVIALAALWTIATDILNLEMSLRIGTGGSVADMGRAATSLATQPDFWLWFYLAFTIANTMFPQTSKLMRNPKILATALILAGALALGLGSEIPTLAVFSSNLGILLNRLSLILFATTALNLVMIFALGMIEAIIERLTGHSATFLDGELVTRTRQQSRKEQANHQREGRTKRDSREASIPVKTIRTIYALPLPIPGPPGKEPVSKPVAAVLNVSDARKPYSKPIADNKPASVVADDPVDASSKIGSHAKRTSESTSRPAVGVRRSGIPSETVRSKTENPISGVSAATTIDDQDRDGAVHAPFSRPFAESHDRFDDPDAREKPESTDLGFARPFAPGPDKKVGIEPEVADSTSRLRASASMQDNLEDKPLSTPGRSKPKMRPVPKPSQRTDNDPGSKDVADDLDELQYEPFDDIGADDDGDEFYDDSS